MHDIIIVGAGPAGLSAGIKLKLLNSKLKIGILEKANTIGGHLISGTILQKSAYAKYVKQYNLSSDMPITKERVMCLSKRSQFSVSWALPVSVRNEGNVLLSVNELCAKMCLRAQRLGISVYTNSGATGLVINDTTVMGVTACNGAKMLAKHTMLAEGACGTVTSKLIKCFNLKSAEPQTYALGIREEWTPASSANAGTVWHTIGWPATQHTELAGGFVYAYANNITIGYITHLSYNNSYVCPYSEFVKFKSHPAIRKILVNRKRVRYGARVISTGGINSVPEVCYQGCTVIGCAAGLVNILKLKGIHNALISGESAAESFISSACKISACKLIPWVAGRIQQELYNVKNVCKALKRYGKATMLIEQFIANTLRIRLTLSACCADSVSTKLCISTKRLPQDWGISDSRSEALKLSRLSYKSEASHLSVSNNTLHKLCDLRLYDKLTTRLCPAKVYAWVKVDKHYEFRAQHDSCIQCKSCCVKPAMQTICWTIAQKGGGPNYN
ncbi:MAG: electron-transfer flavoprotein:ubiquinone oxidoreductase [Candidatus Hodgkinia cicadicola]